MYRIDIASASSTLPTPASPGTAGYFTDGNPGLGQAPTIVPADWMNRIQEELISLLTAASITPVKTSYNQVASSVQSGALNYAVDSSGSANTIIASLPIPPGTLRDGFPIKIKIANTNTGATNLNLNGGGNVAVTDAAGNALISGSLLANKIYNFTYNSTSSNWQAVAVAPTANNNLYIGGTTTGSANAQVIPSLSPPSGFSLSNNGTTIVCTAGFTNTGAMTIAVTSPTISATSVKVNSGGGLIDPPAGAVTVGNIITLTVDSGAGVLVLDAGLPANLFLQSANNLSDVGSSSAALGNLNGQPLINVLHVEEQQSSGTNGGTFTSGAWQTRALNTSIINTISGASLSSDTITLPSGTYQIDGYAIANQTNGHMTRLQNTTTNTTIITGSSGIANSTVSENNLSLIKGKFTLSGSTTIQLQHYCNTTFSSGGFGQSVGISGVVETYSSIFLSKVA